MNKLLFFSSEALVDISLIVAHSNFVTSKYIFNMFRLSKEILRQFKPRNYLDGEQVFSHN